MVYVIEQQGIITGSIFYPNVKLEDFGIEPHELVGIAHLKETVDPFDRILNSTDL